MNQSDKPAVRGAFIVKRRDGRWCVSRAGVVVTHFTERSEAIAYAEQRATRELEERTRQAETQGRVPMSRLLKWLDGMDAAHGRAVEAADKPHAHDVSADPLVGCRGCAEFDRVQAEYREKAADFVPRATRLLRMVAEAGCHTRHETGMDCVTWLKAYSGEMAAALDKYGCLHCRVTFAGEELP